MAQVRWTQSQLDAIEARGGTVLVSAAAGSGKTAVLTRRVLEIIADGENPVPADRLLIVTFSNAAAAEMKVRIEQELSERLALEPDNDGLRRQQLALQGAAIGTIHAFCFDLVRRNFQQLGLPADLRIADERELDLLRRETLADLVAQRYEEDDRLFLQTVELFSAARNDERLLKTVLRLYDFTRSHPFPQAWLEEKLALYGGGAPLADSAWGREILTYAADALDFALESIREAVALIREDEKMSAAYLNAFLSDAAGLERTRALIRAGDWDGTAASLRATVFQKLGALRGYGNDAKKQYVSDLRKSVKDLISKLTDKQFCATEEESREDMADLAPKIAVLFQLVNDFAERFDQEKRERRALDFSDLEQYTLRLLCTVTPQGTVEPTEYARMLRGDYGAVLIDEYQDTNEAQEMIFSCLTGGENLFMVGDVKQSIYGFRQASPQIFLEKKDRFAYYNGKDYPAKIILGANFRSHPLICAGVNQLFHACMSRRVGQVDYDVDERLIPLGSFPENQDAGVSLELLDVSASDEAAPLCEARHVARRISDMLAGGRMVADKGALRPMRAGDIGILLRSPRGRADIYLRALAAEGVPAFSGTQSTFLQTTEVSTALAILRAVSNPLADIALVSAMMSPVYAFSAGDVARIRLYKRDAPIYMALLAGGEEGDADARRLLADLADFRRVAAHSSTTRLIRAVYERTALPEIACALDNPEVRAANLRLLAEYAEKYENAGYRTVTQFLRFVESVLENGEDFDPANLSGSRENAVQIMSIHRSKGLEFPVVFLCDCAKRLNRDDLRQNVLLHARLGFACMRRDERTLSQFTTVPLEAARIAAERELVSEEMRVLYVALTRAKERLILTGTSDNPAKKIALSRVRADAGGRLPAHAVSRVQGTLDWLLMAALSTRDGAPLSEYAGVEPAAAAGGGMRCAVVAPDMSARGEPLYPEREEGAAEASRAAPLLRAQLEAGLQRRYAWEDATRIPTKIAVTAIARGDIALHGEDESGGDAADNGARGSGRLFARQPQFITHERLGAAMRGDAFHKYMLFADHPRAAQDPQAEVRRLVGGGFLSEDEASALHMGEVAAFYGGSLYARMCRAQRVEREFRFMTQLGKRDLSGVIPHIGEELVSVQGVCDLLLFTEGRMAVVDYKTDRTDSAGDLAARYAGQLALYARILERMLGETVEECILYSTFLAREIPVGRRALQGAAGVKSP